MPRSATRAKEWVQILVKFDTAPDWISNLTIEYTVLTLIEEGGERRYSLYRQNVEHQDVERGRDHQSTVFIPPAGVLRYGMPVAVHINVLVDGQPAGQMDDIDPGLKLPPGDWWTSPLLLNDPKLTVRAGYLWLLYATPFAFVNPDDYEVMR